MGRGPLLIQQSLLKVVVMMLLLFGLTGCFWSKSSLTLKSSMEVAKDVNPDSEGRPSPVVVRVYHLRSPEVFKSADFFAIYDSEVATLGETFIRREEFEVQPGSEINYDNNADLETKCIGVLAAFRDLDNARWRSFVQLPDDKKINLRIDLERLAVSVTLGER
jgi:type VI secretion system protein VasD